MEDITCCTVSCEKPLDENYWNNLYQNNTTGWDLGEVALHHLQNIASNHNNKLL